MVIWPAPAPPRLLAEILERRAAARGVDGDRRQEVAELLGAAGVEGQ
jgi:hypothetical protein